MRVKPKAVRDGSREELGFEVRARCDPALDASARKRLAARFASEAIEVAGLVCGGGVFGPAPSGNALHVVVAKDKAYASCTNRDRRRVERWFAAQREITEHRVGPLAALESDYDVLGQAPALPHPRGRNELERALSLRQEAIAAFREAAETLGRPEMRGAVSLLERSVALAEAAVDEVARALLLRLRVSVRDGAHDRLWDLFMLLENAATHGYSRRGTSWIRDKLRGALFNVHTSTGRRWVS